MANSTIVSSEHPDKSVASQDENPVSRVQFSGDADEFVLIGGHKYHRHELMQAFGGNLNPGLSPYPKRTINPVPVGLAAFSLTLFVFCMYTAEAMGIKIPNVMIGSACFYGGTVQMLCGILTFLNGNTFGATVITSFGAFWLSFMAIFVEDFGIAQAYTDPKMFSNAVGFFLLGWAILIWVLTILTLKSTVPIFAFFFLLALAFTLLSSGYMVNRVNVKKAGAIIGAVDSFISWYLAFAGTSNRQNSYITSYHLPMPTFGKKGAFEHKPFRGPQL